MKLFFSRLCYAFLCLTLLPLSSQGQTDSDARQEQEEIPEWLAELSNLPREQRDEYIRNFALAKQALNTGDWVTCDAALTSCEFIFNRNPNIHNLRIVCYIEQKRLQAADEEMRKALKLIPDDPTTLVNLATLRMAQQDYRGCISEMTAVLQNAAKHVKQEVRDILLFRIVLCHLMLGEITQAEDLVADLSPLSDTPLYYYSRAAVCLYLHDAKGAQEDLQSAARIFSTGGMLVPYQRALLSCDLTQANQ